MVQRAGVQVEGPGVAQVHRLGNRRGTQNECVDAVLVDDTTVGDRHRALVVLGVADIA